MTDGPELFIGDLRVPEPLLAAVQEERWVAPDDQALLASTFGDPPQQPKFYSVDSMSAAWLFEMDPETRGYYLGSKSLENPPGDTDPARSLLIGELGPDQPVALEYRTSNVNPSVVYLRINNGWVEIAPNIGSLIDMLRL